MATQIKLRRDTYQNWYDNNPVLAQGEPGWDLTNKKLKIGDGSTTWRLLAYFDDQQTDLSAYAGHILPATDVTYDLGSDTKRFRDLYLSGNTINLGGSLISVAQDGTVAIPGVSVFYYVPDSIQDYGVFSQPDDWEEFNNDPWEPLTFSDVPVIIDHFTYLLAFYGSLEGPNQASFLAAREGYVPTVYTPIMSNGTSGALTGIVITTPGSYDPSKPETIGIEGVNTDNMIALPAGTDINDWDSLVAAINGEAYPEGYGGIGLGVNMVASTSAVVGLSNYALTSTIPADISDLTDNGNLLGSSDLSAVAQNIIPSVDSDGTTGYTLGSPDFKWKELFVSNGSIYIGDVKLSNVAGKLRAVKVINPGEVDEEEDPDDSDAASEIGNGSGVQLPSQTGQEGKFLRTDGEDLSWVAMTGGGEGLPTITVPETPAVLYKGLQASYGMIHSNDDDDDELNVNKIVIHKPAVTTTTIDPSSEDDDFEVSGLGASDVLAMFVVYGDVNEAKPLSDLQAFAEEVIDLVILDGGVEGDFNTVDAMKAAFYANYADLAAAANGLYTNFNFFTSEEIWPENSISDGGADQYDTANFISTNLANNINYNSGNTVVDGSAAFGTGSTYTFVYDTAIFGLFATGSSATLIRTSGNSGADGDSTTEAGNLFGAAVPEQTFDNAVSFINLVGEPYAGPLVSFTHSDDGDEVDILIADDGEGSGVAITRGNGGNGIYNPYREGEWDSDVSPGGTQWNTTGWTDLADVESRTYTNLYAAFGSGGLGNKIVGTECVMYLPDNGKYYAVKFTQWTQNNAGGGFAYTRQELDLDSLETGIRFQDGTRQTTAYVPTNVKLTAPGNRRIEEVSGYKSVSVTERILRNLTTTASRNSDGQARIWINSTTTTIDEILNNTTAAGIVDNTTWYKRGNGTFSDGDERGFVITLGGATLTYSQGATVYFRYVGGGGPVVWWDKDDLPGGSSNFRGAVIDYHAYTGDATIIGTIHIVDDDGEENITHTEVSSGSSDSENDDLWYVTSEGEIQYRRLDGESSTLKIQWSAKVFYGSELYD
jgi:hypothetical protein